MPNSRTSRALLTALRGVAKDKSARRAETRLEACRYLLILEGVIQPARIERSVNASKLKALLYKKKEPPPV